MQRKIYDEFCELEAELSYTFSTSIAQKRNALMPHVLPYIFHNARWNDSDKALRIRYVVNRPCFYQYFDKTEDLRNQCYPNLDGNTPFIEAAAKGYTECLKVLSHCVDHIDQRNYSYKTALMEAARFGQLKCMHFLMSEKEGDKAYLNTKDNDGNTPLILAIFANQLESVHELLKNKPYLEIQNDDKLTALDFAIEAYQFDMAAALIKNGAKINNPSFLFNAIVGKNLKDDHAYVCLKALCANQSTAKLTKKECVLAKLYLRQLSVPFCQRIRNFFMREKIFATHDEKIARKNIYKY